MLQGLQKALGAAMPPITPGSTTPVPIMDRATVWQCSSEPPTAFPAIHDFTARLRTPLRPILDDAADRIGYALV